MILNLLYKTNKKSTSKPTDERKYINILSDKTNNSYHINSLSFTANNAKRIIRTKNNELINSYLDAHALDIYNPNKELDDELIEVILPFINIKKYINNKRIPRHLYKTTIKLINNDKESLNVFFKYQPYSMLSVKYFLSNNHLTLHLMNYTKLEEDTLIYCYYHKKKLPWEIINRSINISKFPKYINILLKENKQDVFINNIRSSMIKKERIFNLKEVLSLSKSIDSMLYASLIKYTLSELEMFCH